MEADSINPASIFYFGSDSGRTSKVIKNRVGRSLPDQ